MDTSRKEMGHAVKSERRALRRSGSSERGVMDSRRAIVALLTLLCAALLLPSVVRGQDTSESKGKNTGDYNIQQSVEFGYRWNGISGNNNTYDTFVNLGQGFRLLDYTLDMRSLDHNGIFFDDLNFSNFGYGGDPNDVTRLHIDKNKWYDFSAMFRRDKNFWDYNLFANPLNPAALNAPGSLTTGCYVGPPTTTYPQGAPIFCSNPVNAQTNSPHALDLVRRMQDYDLVLLPQSRLRFRLGFSHDRNEGPGFLTTDSGTVPAFPEFYSYTTNAYRVGVDYQIAPRTTISYDQFLNYFKQDNISIENPTATPQLYPFEANGVPVDLGIVWSTQTPAEALPCAAPITDSTTTPITANPVCNGFVSYSNVARPRDFMPTERVRFQSNYFQKFEVAGSLGYSSSDYTVPDFNETIVGWTTRTSLPGTTTTGPVKNKRVSTDADLSAAYSFTDKLRLEDSFHYNAWRIPTAWNSTVGEFFPIIGETGLGATLGAFTTAGCNASNNYSGPDCPNHTLPNGSAASTADIAVTNYANFFKEDMKSNTLELEYDFSSRVSADIGYRYTRRQIVTSAGNPDNLAAVSIYYPGGSTASAANDYLAARGSCALIGGELPSGCTLNADGSITYAAPALGAPEVDTMEINENALVLGVRLTPVKNLRITGDLTWGYNDAAYTRIDARNMQSYKIHATYTPKPWASLDGSVQIHENRDNVYTVNGLEHDRAYSATATLMPKPSLAVSIGYNYWDVYMQDLICFNYSVGPRNAPVITTPPGVSTTACTIPDASVNPGGLETLSTYASQDHFAHADVMWKPVKRVTAALGYGGSFVRGNTIFLDQLTPSGTLDYDYQMPYGSLTFDLGKGLSYKTAWNYYGFNETGVTNPFGLAGIPLQDFNGSNVMFSLRYAF